MAGPVYPVLSLPVRLNAWCGTANRQPEISLSSLRSYLIGGRCGGGEMVKIRRFLWLATALSLGCASGPRAEDSVRIVHDPEFVRGCQPVGLVEAVSSTAGAKSQSYYESYEAR